MKVLFAGGGTAGHINPAIAVADKICEIESGSDIRFFGSPDRLEAELVPQAGYKLYTAALRGLTRKISIKGIGANIDALKKLCAACRECRKILKEFSPDIVIGTGGYVSFPAVYTAQKMGIPTILMEFNALPGVVTKTLANKAKKVLVGFEAAKQRLGGNENIIITGSPVKNRAQLTDRDRAKEQLNMLGKPLVVSFWGSLGAEKMNEKMVDFIKLNKQNGEFYHIHAAGKKGFEQMKASLADAGISDANGIFLKDYIYNMPTLMAAADVILCRAGSSTLAEICAAGRASVLVPSPNVAENHQEINALTLAQAGAAVLLKESECSGEILYKTVTDILKNTNRRKEMEKNAAKLGKGDAARRVYDEIVGVIKAN